MRAVIAPDGSLLITHAETFWLYVAGAIELAAFVTWRTPHPHALTGAVAYVVMGLVFTIPYERTRFLFDVQRRMVEWRRRTPLRAEAGTIPFGHITRISMDTVPTMRGRTVQSARRLTLHTTNDIVPISSTATAS